ncbi:recombination-associated protein RdgC [Comamonas jiangduensis]|uniref:recombination-associated protein RdgC n=1 Tax=Comamonas jiangduensis TaxID=1194168 RepID=UPI0015817691|nr:recombination-associated protein RdgC [Comamonas jiangduensis]
MKQIIKSATVYKADFGIKQEALADKLQASVFQECPPTRMRSWGFVPVADGDHLVLPFKNGFAFRVRIDEKQIPASVINQKVNEAAERIKELDNRTPGKKERAEIKDEVLMELAKQAFPRTAIITCFYQQTTGYLIVPTTSKKLADIIVTSLVHAAGSVKTETIHVSDVKHGLTTRLQAWANGNDDAFGVFQPCAEAALKQGERKINIKMGSLRGAETGIKEALAASFEVMSMGFTHDGETEFRLTHDFKLKGIECSHTDSEDEEEVSFYSQATLEVDAVSSIITDLVEMIGHGKDAQSTEAHPANP